MNKQKVENFSFEHPNSRCVIVWDRSLGSDVTVLWPGGHREKPVIGKMTFRVKGEKK